MSLLLMLALTTGFSHAAFTSHEVALLQSVYADDTSLQTPYAIWSLPTPAPGSPLYSLLLSFWLSLTGTTPLVLRWTDLLFVLISAAAACRSVRAVVAGRTGVFAGVAALLVTGVVVWHWAVTPTPFAAACVFVCLLSSALWVRCRTWQSGLLLAVTLALSFYAWLTAAVVLLLVNIVLLLRVRSGMEHAAWLLTAAVLALPAVSAGRTGSVPLRPVRAAPTLHTDLLALRDAVSAALPEDAVYITLNGAAPDERRHVLDYYLGATRAVILRTSGLPLDGIDAPVVWLMFSGALPSEADAALLSAALRDYAVCDRLMYSLDAQVYLYQRTDSGRCPPPTFSEYDEPRSWAVRRQALADAP